MPDPVELAIRDCFRFGEDYYNTFDDEASSANLLALVRKLVAEEREACAKVAEDRAKEYAERMEATMGRVDSGVTAAMGGGLVASNFVADAIREMGK